jgi:hypothetical protein
MNFKPNQKIIDKEGHIAKIISIDKSCLLLDGYGLCDGMSYIYEPSMQHKKIEGYCVIYENMDFKLYRPFILLINEK